MYGPLASQPMNNDPAPLTTVNRDTECSYYFALMLQMTFSVLLSYREIPSIKMQSTQSDVGVFTAIWIGWGLS
nr:MAG TPA: hypothetical protein [Caudoviricetes sp.]